MRVTAQKLPRRAFTLIELLAVISVIAILVSLLIPAVSRAKYAAKNATCRNNLQQISMALQMYVSTYDNRYPYTYRQDLNTEQQIAQAIAEGQNGSWYGLLGLPLPYRDVTNDFGSVTRCWGGVFRCPMLSYIESVNGVAPEHLWLLEGSYGYNAYGVGIPPFDSNQPMIGLEGTMYSDPSDPFLDMRYGYIRENDVKSPVNMIAIGDLFLRSRNPSFDTTIDFEPIIMPSGRMNSIRTPNRKQPAFIAHHGRCNRSFVDGHLESEDMRRNFDARDDQLARWNNDNLPHRECLRDSW